MITEEQAILSKLQEMFPGQIAPKLPFPKSYPDPVNPNKVKAIYLGCDATNHDEILFDHVFALGNTPVKFRAFVTTHTNQLSAIGLTWKDVYTQNLCKNYFIRETSKNLRIWKAAANEYWIESLKKELLMFDLDIPVLLTSQYLYDVLVDDPDWKDTEAPDFYQCKVDIPVPASVNKLERPLIPLYRGRSPRLKASYYLHNNDNFTSYIDRVKEILRLN